MEKFFRFVLVIILFIHIFLHYHAIANNNIHFTIDQGNDALYVRDIIERHTILLKGPETSVRGIFAGPLWYYVLVPGYLIFNGHPVGGVATLIFLNALLITLIMIWIKNKVGLMPSITSASILLFSWFFFETSLYSFNPFPTLTTTFIRMILLIEFLLGKKKYYYWSVLVTLLTFNFDVAIAVALTIFTYMVGLWGVKKKIISLKEYIISSFTLPAIPLLFLSKQFAEVFWQSHVLNPQHTGLGVFAGTNILPMISEFLKMVGTITPWASTFGIVLYIGVTVAFFRLKKPNLAVRSFAILALSLGFISFLFFASNRGWRSWHTVYLPPILLIAFTLMASQLKKQIAIIILTTVFVAKFTHFEYRFNLYRAPSTDASILYNELSAIDWIYQNTESQGFKVYNYTDRYYDDPYQYLFWWYGLKKYKYLPDEYSNYPLSHKELYVPGNATYLEPKRGSDRIAFLIIQSDTNGEKNEKWIDTFREYHKLENKTQIGLITVEKYSRNSNAPSDFCIWREKCD